ncbi:tyrosine-type recombinase/integrase [Chitinibacter bivalviorum]|uniref:tyrosine-type recombinase/integrase n=1 Tax=Chitinibacter bivalviorum TaxID=2739434 RepID=UPI003F68FA38
MKASPGGSKKYVLESRLLTGKSIRLTIGSPSVWSIGDAIAEARRLQTLIDAGLDPREEKASKLKAQTARKLEMSRAEITLGDVWPKYLAARREKWSDWHIRDHERVVHPGGVKKIRGKGLTEPGPLAPLLQTKLTELCANKISTWLASETDARPTQAALAFRLLSVFVNWCDSMEEYAGLVPSGACKARQVKEEVPAKKAKDGDCLQSEQLQAWFSAVIHLSNPIHSAYLQALLLTGARRRELVGLRWSDVDFQWNSLTIRDKVEGARTIPLTPYLAAILSQLPRINGWVFSSKTSANGQLTEPTSAHYRALENAGLPHLTLHGLRRSFGTLAEWVEAPTGVVAQIMGHKPSAIAEKHYRRRPLDLLRKWHVVIEKWILTQAKIDCEQVIYD